MRKVIVQMQVSVDGYAAGPAGELDWMTPPEDPAQLAILDELTQGMDTILMGRKMAAGFTAHWEDVADNQPASPEHAYAELFVNTPKIVFSKTTPEIPGTHVQVEHGDLATVIRQLKSLPGKNMIVYGGAGFVRSLVENQLADELYLFVNPMALGAGLPLFPAGAQLQLLQSTAFTNGVVLNRYAPAGTNAASTS